MVDQNTQAQLKKRFAELPPAVQRAITSVDVQKQLREAADRHKLHLDQWEILENEVLMTLFGITPIDELQGSIQKEVKVTAEIAAELAADISRIVFEPIRQELERQLEHPGAKEKKLTGVEQAREQALGQGSGFRGQVSGNTNAEAQAPVSRQLKAENSPVPATPGPAPVQPATPPPPPPAEKAIRGPASGAYVAGTPSSARKDIHDDPYREPPQ